MPENSLTVVLSGWDEHTDAAAQLWPSSLPKSPLRWHPEARNHKSGSLHRNEQEVILTGDVRWLAYSIFTVRSETSQKWVLYFMSLLIRPGLRTLPTLWRRGIRHDVTYVEPDLSGKENVPQPAEKAAHPSVL